MFHPSQKPGPLWQIDHSHPLAQGLVGCWLFNEEAGSTIHDFCRLLKNHATGVNTPTWTKSMRPNTFFRGWGPALTLNGTTQYASAPFNTRYNNTIDRLAIEMVFRFNQSSPAGNMSLFGRGDIGATSGTWGLRYTGNRMTFRLGTTERFGLTVQNSTDWQHCIGVWDGAVLRLYDRGIEFREVNGIPATAKTSFTPSGTDSLYFGSNNGASEFFNGDIALARLWMNRSFNRGQVDELFNHPWGMFLPETQQKYYMLDRAIRTQSIQLRADVRNVVTRSIQARANIRTTGTQTIQLRGAITRQELVSVQLRAAIEEPETELDTILNTWSVQDNFETYARQFSGTAADIGCLQVGNEISIKAGYDTDRVTVIKGYIDRVTKNRTVGNRSYQVTGRDIGGRELDSYRITKRWESTPTKDMVKAHKIIRDVAGFMGLTVGHIDFPDYDLYNDYVSIGKRGLDIVSELAEPWNLFARVQYISQVRDKTLSVVKVDWENPITGGYVIRRGQHSQQQISQELYLDQPRLNEVQLIIIRGAAWTRPRCEVVGTEIRTEYFRNVATVEVNSSIAGQVTAPSDTLVTNSNRGAMKEVTTETTTVETVYCDKVLNRVETIYVDDELTARTTERFWYYEPGTIQSIIPADTDTFVIQSLTPSEDALLYMAHTKREGLTDRNGGTRFLEVLRQVTQYYYDEEKQVACEQTTTQEFDEDLGQWGISKHASRTHSQITGGSVRTTLQSFTFEDSRYKLSSADIQNVGGTRPSINHASSRKNVLTYQAQSPQGDVDDDGNAIDPGEGLYTWSYENPYIGQAVCDTLYALAQEEKTFQLSGAKWEIITFDGVLNPNINVGRPVEIEREDATFENYIVEDLSHQFGTDFAGTGGTAKRLTTEDLS
jgi:hypothetical protein